MKRLPYDENVTKHIESGADGSDGATAIGGGSGFEDTRDSYFAEAGRLIVSQEKGSTACYSATSRSALTEQPALWTVGGGRSRGTGNGNQT